jgi:pimeloyl-ACP methyl ester carboxylesterase
MPMETVEIDGIRVAYGCVGDGPPLVLLHGFVGDGWTTWRPQIDALSDEFTVVVWDAPGAGRSSDPPESFGTIGYADCLARFIDRLGLDHPHVAGLSFGGVLALELSRRHPSIPRTLILASAYAGWAGSLPGAAAEQRLRVSLEVSDLTPDQFVRSLLPTMFCEGTPAETVDDFGAAMHDAFHRVGFRAMARASASDLRDALPRIHVPTLLIYGENDVRAPRTVAEHLHAAIPGSTLVVVPNAGHVVNIEAPEAFNAATSEFLHNQQR